MVFHDWPDEDCIRIIQQLMPQLKKRKKMFVADQILQPPGTTSMYSENTTRRRDMLMFLIAGGKERSLDNWEALFAKADAPLKVVAYRQPRGSQLAMLEVELV
jgi:6-hydroxytryprostatin B O-methyltransferase